jgi:hypothetical protein
MRFYSLSLIFSLVFITLSFSGAKSLAAEEEYAPIPELNYNPPKEKDTSSMFDDVRLHAGAAFLNSYQNVPLNQTQRAEGGMRGVQFNFGVDLFNPKWILQGALFSLPQATLGNAQVSSNGFELSLLYEASIYEQVTMHGGLGIESRNYGIRSGFGDNSMSSGASVLVTGLDYWPATFVSAGLEVSGHLPLANGDDPSSIDLGIKLNGHF